MKFKSEIELVSVLIEKLSSQYGTGSNIKIFEEVGLGFGVADLVVTNFAGNVISHISTSEKLDANDINLYDLISKNSEGITYEAFKTILRTNDTNIRISLRKLLSQNYILERDEKFFINKKYLFPFKNNFAIEAKLRDWKRALKQAYRYKWFAEYSFVVIDEFYSKKAIENIDVFKKYNVGLATLSEDFGIKKYYFPTPDVPFDIKMKMRMSEMVRHQEFDK